MIILETDRLIVRNWRTSDRELFFEINSHERVMEFFPMRRSREEADELLDRIRGIIEETGLGFYALELKTTGEPIGFCGLARTDLEPHLPDGTVEIGWRLAERFWGQGYVTEAAKALLIHAFDTLGLDEVVSFAVTVNVRSTSVMRRIGMRHDPVRDFNHPRVPDSHPALGDTCSTAFRVPNGRRLRRGIAEASPPIPLAPRRSEGRHSPRQS